MAHRVPTTDIRPMLLTYVLRGSFRLALEVVLEAGVMVIVSGVGVGSCGQLRCSGRFISQ